MVLNLSKMFIRVFRDDRQISLPFVHDLNQNSK